MIRRPPRSTQSRSSAASDVYKRQAMITLGRITQQADADGVDADTVERDYVITHVMASLALHPENGTFQFKGGTLLRLCYFSGYRYSADLDLNLEPDVDLQ